MNHKLLNGDCIELMATLPDKSVDMVLCDLSYGTTNCRWDIPINLEKLWEHYKRICKGAIVLFAQTPFDKVLGSSNLEMLRYEWIWQKTHPTGHLNAKRMPMKSHENILVFYNKLPTYNPQKTSGHQRKTAQKNYTDNFYGAQKIPEKYDSTDRYPRSVIIFASDKQKSNFHPTQKPLSLCEYLILTYTNERDVVLDNCMGSGTTAIAAANTSRNFIGIELDNHYFSVAEQRIDRMLGLTAMNGGGSDET